MFFYWAFTLTVIGAFFSPLVPLAQFAAQVALLERWSCWHCWGRCGMAQLKFSDRRQPVRSCVDGSKTDA